MRRVRSKNASGRNVRRISFFNHKGGVGKTTLTYNVASTLAELGYRVLLVDTDPQCNLTAQLIDADVLDDLLDNSDGAEGRTIWSAVKPIVETTGSVNEIEPIELRKNLYLIPGDIRLSDFEADLVDFWRECFQRKKRGFTGTAAISALVTRVCRSLRVDFVFFDTGPNVGALNRAILLDCDYFVIPVAYDLFSVRALKTLGRTLHSWVVDYETISAIAPADMELLSGRPIFLGYLPQNYSVYRGGVATHQARYIALLDKGIGADIVRVLRDLGIVPLRRNYRIGEVKNFGTLVAASQREGTTIAQTTAGSPAQRKVAQNAFNQVAKKILQRVV